MKAKEKKQTRVYIVYECRNQSAWLDIKAFELESDAIAYRNECAEVDRRMLKEHGYEIIKENENSHSYLVEGKVRNVVYNVFDIAMIKK